MNINIQRHLTLPADHSLHSLTMTCRDITTLCSNLLLKLTALFKGSILQSVGYTTIYKNSHSCLFPNDWGHHWGHHGNSKVWALHNIVKKANVTQFPVSLNPVSILFFTAKKNRKKQAAFMMNKWLYLYETLILQTIKDRTTVTSNPSVCSWHLVGFIDKRTL